MEFDAPEEMSTGGNYLNVPGVFHFSIDKVHEGTGPKGGVINGFCFSLSVLDGTVEGQESKMLDLTFFDPDMSKSEAAQRIAKDQQAAALIAAGLLDPAKLGQRVSINLAEAEGRQVVAMINEDEYNGRTNYRLHYSNIWHVDDPRAEKYPKSKEALGLIPAEQRKPAGYFESITEKKGGQAQRQPALTSAQLADL